MASAMSGPLVFLVTPSLNQARWLRECLACVRNLGAEVEHFVQDGGSTDGTLELLRTQGAPHISASDGGLYPALNRALRRGSAPLLGWLNCDDLLFPWVPAVLARAREAHPDADVFYGDALELREQRLALVHTPAPWLLEAFFHSGGVLPQPAVFFTPRLFERLGGLDASYRLMADQDLWLRAHAAGARFVHLPELLAVQRMVDGQLMERFADRVDGEKRRLAHHHGVAVPGSLRDQAGRRLQAALHRAGLWQWLSGQGFEHAHHAQVVGVDWAGLWRVAVGSSSGVAYARKGPGWGNVLQR